jgi:hypothetical protein
LQPEIKYPATGICQMPRPVIFTQHKSYLYPYLSVNWNHDKKTNAALRLSFVVACFVVQRRQNKPASRCYQPMVRKAKTVCECKQRFCSVLFWPY